jgi:hypothetical protein
MCEFLGACLDNLNEYALDAELEEISDCLTEQQVMFLKKLVDYTKKKGPMDQGSRTTSG